MTGPIDHHKAIQLVAPSPTVLDRLSRTPGEEGLQGHL